MIAAGFVTNLIGDAFAGLFWGALSWLPMPAMYAVAFAAGLAVLMIPIIGPWLGARGAVAVAVVVLAIGYQGKAASFGYENGYERGHRVGYALGHKDGLKNWKPAPEPRGKIVVPATKDYAAKLEEAAKPTCVRRKNSTIPGSC